MRRVSRSTAIATAALTCLACVMLAGDTLNGQGPAKKPVAKKKAPGLDKVSQEATRLEGELGKYKDNSPSAIQPMLKLIDLYHKHARVFGLVRIAGRFVAAHPAHAKHSEVMLKLMDGQQIMSRNKDLATSCRQFLTRYPRSPKCTAVEIRLAQTLKKMKNASATADAYRAIWKRAPGPATKNYAAEALRLYVGTNNASMSTRGGELAEEIVKRLPAGTFTEQCGLQGVTMWTRIGKWAFANRAAAALIRKGLPRDAEAKRQLHITMGNNYNRLAQYANSAAAIKQARAMKDEPALLANQIDRVYSSGAKSSALLPLIQEYFRKFPKAEDRYGRRSVLIPAYRRDGDNVSARRIMREQLPFDAISNNAAYYYATSLPPKATAAEIKQTEQTLINAISKNKKHAGYLRYVLATYIYQGRMKDVNRARATLREMLRLSPNNNGNDSSAISTLLYGAATDQEFQNDTRMLMSIRRKFVHLRSLQSYIDQWSRGARRNKKIRNRVAFYNQELRKSRQDQVLKLWTSSSNRNGAKARAQLLANPLYGQLTKEQKRMILSSHAYYTRYYGPSKRRKDAIGLYRRILTDVDRKDRDAMLNLIGVTSDYGTKQECRATINTITGNALQAKSSDAWRRMMVMADRTEDANLVKKAYAWIRSNEQKVGMDANYASYIGDTLAKHKMQAAAEAHWRRYITFDRNHSQSSQCAARILNLTKPEQRLGMLTQLVASKSNYYGTYAIWLAAEQLKNKNVAQFSQLLKESRRRQLENPFVSWGHDTWMLHNLVQSAARLEKEKPVFDDGQKRQIYEVVKSLQVDWPSATSSILLLRMDDKAGKQSKSAIDRLLAYQQPTQIVNNDSHRWDQLMYFAQAAVNSKEFDVASTLLTGMLANVTNAGGNRKKQGRDMLAQCYSRMGAVGLTINDNSPLAPILQAALYLRLGDERLAFDAYLANKQLFDEQRDKLPLDLILFVCRRLIAASGDENHNKVEEILRGWLIKNSESKAYEVSSKADVQLLLAKNYFRGQRYDVARSEFTTVMNRYPKSPQAIEAEFGIGETFMAQKVYDQAETIFEKLANSKNLDIVVRAEFLRGVLAFRRGENETARDIFRSVLDRVPNVELANQALFNLSEVYGAEQRYLDQLNLLRTVGRLGRTSKRRHKPGMPLAIVVHDSDLGISRGHNRIPVTVTTVPGGDKEQVMLISAGAGKGLFRADLETRLGSATAGDKVLQLTGKDTIKCDYPVAFKKEFKNVPLSDVEIRIAANAEFAVASNKIVDREKETFSQRLQREAQEKKDADQRVSQGRPANQVKPGNLIYLRVADPDRDLKNEADEVVVKLSASSGDEVQAKLKETGPHTGVFEGTVKTGELPASAQATDTSINHSPLMAIDKDPKSFWLSEPNGEAPKSLTVDLKDLKTVSRVIVSTPRTDINAPVRGELLGSQDGEFWFRLAGYPYRADVRVPEIETSGPMEQRVYRGYYLNYSSWSQIANVLQNTKPRQKESVETLNWSIPIGEKGAKNAHAVIWHGTFVQPADGAVRLRINAVNSAMVVDGQLELAPKRGVRTIDLWLKQGAHKLTVFAATDRASRPVSVAMARADFRSATIRLRALRKTDFDISRLPKTKAAQEPLPVLANFTDAKVNKKTEKFGIVTTGKEKKDIRLTNWLSIDDKVSWSVPVAKAGAYELWLDYSHQGGGSKFEVAVGQQKLAATTINTGNWNRFARRRLGAISVEKAGNVTVAIEGKEIAAGRVMDLKRIALVPVQSTAIVQRGQWDFRCQPHKLRYVRFMAHEFLGEALAINNVEVFGDNQKHIPTNEDVLKLANNNILEIAGGDTVTATYTDEVTQTTTGASRLLSGTLTATYFNGRISPISYDFARSASGQVTTRRKELLRIDPGEPIIVEVRDFDRDQTAKQDTVKLEVILNDGKPIELTATETDEYSGIFTKEIFTSKDDEAGKLKVKPGDRVRCRYVDDQNTFPGHAVPRETVIYVNEPTDAKIRILSSRTIPPPENSNARPRIQYISNGKSGDISRVSFAAPLTIEVIDPDSAKDSLSSIVVRLRTSDGAKVDVRCVVSSAFKSRQIAGTSDYSALEEGRFVGQVVMQLGGKNSPTVVPVTSEMPRNLIGGPVMGKDANAQIENLVTKVLNINGKDLIAAGYVDKRRTDGKADLVAARARMTTPGELLLTDREYAKPIKRLHVGEKLFLKVVDADRDTTDQRDEVTVEVTTKSGEKEQVKLVETLAHSGVFTASAVLKSATKPEPGNIEPNRPMIESQFGDQITAKYVDPIADSEDGKLTSQSEVPIVIGTNGLVLAFSKVFSDEKLAVETKFHIAESYFELFKSHKELGRKEEEKADLRAGRRILREVMEDYPDPKHVPRVAYLLGQFAQELQRFEEAIQSYDLIVRRYPDHPLAADAQYKMAQSYEESGDFDEALEAYVTLAATYPKSPLIANVMIRISDYFYKKEQFQVAARVGEKFLEKFRGHQYASRIAFRVGQCYYKNKKYAIAGKAFDRFAKIFPDDKLCADALFWSGESYRLGKNARFAFRRYNRCRWDFPSSEAAKYARGRLALPEMLSQFEAEANSLENENDNQ